MAEGIGALDITSAQILCSFRKAACQRAALGRDSKKLCYRPSVGPFFSAFGSLTAPLLRRCGWHSLCVRHVRPLWGCLRCQHTGAECSVLHLCQVRGPLLPSRLPGEGNYIRFQQYTGAGVTITRSCAANASLHVALQYLKSIRLERNRKTGFKCPRGCGKGSAHKDSCPGKIDKSHPIHPRNEEQKKKKKVQQLHDMQ